MATFYLIPTHVEEIKIWLTLVLGKSVTVNFLAMTDNDLSKSSKFSTISLDINQGQWLSQIFLIKEYL